MDDNGREGKLRRINEPSARIVCATPTRLPEGPWSIPQCRDGAQPLPIRARSSSCRRSTRRCTLPVVVIGSASMNSISFGYS